jgi:hypothetical protein
VPTDCRWSLRETSSFVPGLVPYFYSSLFFDRERNGTISFDSLSVNADPLCWLGTPRLNQKIKKGGSMALIRHSDWPALGGSMLSDFFDDDVFFNRPMGRRSMPSVNIKETDKSYELEMAAPGYSKKDFKISIDNNMMTVSA